MRVMIAGILGPDQCRVQCSDDTWVCKSDLIDYVAESIEDFTGPWLDAFADGRASAADIDRAAINVLVQLNMVDDLVGLDPDAVDKLYSWLADWTS